MRLAGQSICTEYTPSSSGTYINAVWTSLINFFNYDAATTRLIQRGNYRYSEWLRIICQELAARRPVYYAGHSSNSGHFFVVDGYQSEDFFHINWGWYGNKQCSMANATTCRAAR